MKLRHRVIYAAKWAGMSPDTLMNLPLDYLLDIEACAYAESCVTSGSDVTTTSH